MTETKNQSTKPERRNSLRNLAIVGGLLTLLGVASVVGINSYKNYRQKCEDVDQIAGIESHRYATRANVRGDSTPELFYPGSIWEDAEDTDTLFVEIDGKRTPGIALPGWGGSGPVGRRFFYLGFPNRAKNFDNIILTVRDRDLSGVIYNFSDYPFFDLPTRKILPLHYWGGSWNYDNIERFYIRGLPNNPRIPKIEVDDSLNFKVPREKRK